MKKEVSDITLAEARQNFVDLFRRKHANSTNEFEPHEEKDPLSIKDIQEMFKKKLEEQKEE